MMKPASDVSRWRRALRTARQAVLAASVAAAAGACGKKAAPTGPNDPNVPAPPGTSVPNVPTQLPPAFTPPATPPAPPPGRPSHVAGANPSARLAPSLSGSASRTPPSDPFFRADEAGSPGAVYYSPSFGYYFPLTDDRYYFKYSCGYLYVYQGDPSVDGNFMYDFTSGHIWYTNSSLYRYEQKITYVYDYTLRAYLYYFDDVTDGSTTRYFYNVSTGKYLTQ